MNHRCLARLARQNIAHNRQGYLPYALSCAGLAMMLFVVMALEYNLALGQVYGARTLARSLRLAQWVMLLFIAVFLLYTHSFLIKRRQQEFGLFNILGMEKRHIARVLAIETALVGLASTLAGIALGAITSRLFFLILLRVLSADSGMSMVIPRDAVLTTLAVFAALHALTVARRCT